MKSFILSTLLLVSLSASAAPAVQSLSATVQEDEICGTVRELFAESNPVLSSRVDYTSGQAISFKIGAGEEYLSVAGSALVSMVIAAKMNNAEICLQAPFSRSKLTLGQRTVYQAVRLKEK